MAFQPWYQHDTYPPLPITLNVEGNADNITGLTAASFTMIIRDTVAKVDTTGTGTFVVTGSNPASVTYQFSDADTLVGASCQLIIEAIFPGTGGGKAVYDPIAFNFTAI